MYARIYIMLRWGIKVVSSLNIPEDIVKRLLHSLSCGKFKVLLKEPAGRTIGSSDRFKVNTAFTCPMRKVMLVLVAVPADGWALSLPHFAL